MNLRILFPGVLSLLTACGTAPVKSPSPAPVESRTVESGSQASVGAGTGPASRTGEQVPLQPPQRADSPTRVLMENVDQAMADGELERAAALTERALRIDSQDGYLWLRLGEIRLRQQRNGEAIELARRAQSVAGLDRRLNTAADDLIQRARSAGSTLP